MAQPTDRTAPQIPPARFDWKEALSAALGGYYPAQVPMEYVIDQARKDAAET